jgi:hypothetical protein
MVKRNSQETTFCDQGVDFNKFIETAKVYITILRPVYPIQACSCMAFRYNTTSRIAAMEAEPCMRHYVTSRSH